MADLRKRLSRSWQLLHRRLPRLRHRGLRSGHRDANKARRTTPTSQNVTRCNLPTLGVPGPVVDPCLKLRRSRIPLSTAYPRDRLMIARALEKGRSFSHFCQLTTCEPVLPRGHSRLVFPVRNPRHACLTAPNLDARPVSKPVIYWDS